MSLLQNRYKLLSELGQGSYGTVYSAHDIVLDKNIAIKLSDSVSKLSHEVNIYRLLNLAQSPVGVPKFYSYFVDDKQEFIAMELLGPSLRSLYHSRGDKFSVKTVAMLGIHMVTLLESMHDRGILHCDVKDDNFLMSSGKVYIIDFGMSRTFVDLITHVHVEENIDPDNVGTLSFSSINTHRKVTATRRDDMESLGYILVRWLKGSLPWEQSSSRDRFLKLYREAGLMKESLTTEKLCEGLPKEILAFLNHVKNLKFDEQPNYANLRYLLNSLLIGLGESNDGIYDWMHK